MVRKNLNEIVFSYFHIIIDHLYVIKFFLFQLLERCIETNLVLFWRFCSASWKAFFEFINRWRQEKNCFYLVSFFLQNWLNVDHPLWFDDVERIFIFTQNAIQFRKSWTIQIRMNGCVFNKISCRDFCFKISTRQKIVVHAIYFARTHFARSCCDNFGDMWHSVANLMPNSRFSNASWPRKNKNCLAHNKNFRPIIWKKHKKSNTFLRLFY